MHNKLVAYDLMNIKKKLIKKKNKDYETIPDISSKFQFRFILMKNQTVCIVIVGGTEHRQHKCNIDPHNYCRFPISNNLTIQTIYIIYLQI